MKKLIGITGSGAIGTDPLHPDTWSGSSRRFFLECKSKNILDKTFGVEVPIYAKFFYALRNYSKCKIRWKRQYYMDIGYRKSLTHQITKCIEHTDFTSDFFQIGSMYNVPEIVHGRSRCYSYNDGNFIMSLQSPYFPKNISQSIINKTIEYEHQVNQGLDRIYTMSEYLKNSFIRDYGISSDKVICIGAGINLDNLPIVNNNKNYSKKNILFIGIDFERKGGNDLLRAFKIVRQLLPDTILNIIGPKQQVDHANIPGIIWHGLLRKNVMTEANKLHDLFNNSSLFVMPSLYEPFGIAPLEAMSYQIPCIVSNAWALPEIVPQNVCGKLVSPGNCEELAECIISLLSNPSLLKEYGEAGRRHVENNFTWDKVVQRLISSLSV